MFLMMAAAWVVAALLLGLVIAGTVGHAESRRAAENRRTGTAPPAPSARDVSVV